MISFHLQQIKLPSLRISDSAAFAGETKTKRFPRKLPDWARSTFQHVSPASPAVTDLLASAPRSRPQNIRARPTPYIPPTFALSPQPVGPLRFPAVLSSSGNVCQCMQFSLTVSQPPNSVLVALSNYIYCRHCDSFRPLFLARTGFFIFRSLYVAAGTALELRYLCLAVA
ncbi:Piso0_001552 [Millerozyma farinosa CBS 7064]|uniref:Piso0_001552 protein n=1 Tax=Pichia sorbitophila (strain ATCC MYA-4447 / BCRC 22081 / CBS 7064 / NBRC 10061 / NRRL Y-12695) TaxID=559304 RepID=G8YNG9_PICSO|nr:Piso0_001552 [Millerozyma farinosa CBS 7064]